MHILDPNLLKIQTDCSTFVFGHTACDDCLYLKLFNRRYSAPTDHIFRTNHLDFAITLKSLMPCSASTSKFKHFRIAVSGGAIRNDLLCFS